jgi:hypothetical protein
MNDVARAAVTETKRREEKPKMKSCTKRNLVYKTWCQTCLARGTPPATTEDQGTGGEGDHVRPMVGGAGGGGGGSEEERGILVGEMR